ncbi:hypothetical protein EEL31_21560 [Brevibacillus laterosporus]|nr:hypothetical protein [Brevibacillus laterosporus]TPG70775.1 hypothetical protein EEL31_21560 [Brevibacillus laterosporus]
MSTGLYYDAKRRDIAFNGYDLATTSDIEWLEQRLYLRILCEKGELLDYPDYGTNLWLMLSKGTRPSNLQAIERELMETLLQDPDVIEAKEIQIIVDGDNVEISAVVVTAIGEVTLRVEEELV